MKKKILLISGVTGIGKSQIANQICSQLGGEIILTDSCQIYKNYPVASNCYQQYDIHNTVKLMQEYDIYNNKLNSYEYSQLVKQEIVNTLENDRVCILEGGCGFYLKYLLENSQTQETEQKVEEANQQLKELISEFKDDINKYKDYLFKILENKESYNISFFNDIYRIQRAIKYTIINNGKSCILEQNDDESLQLKNQYDIRAVFLNYDQEDYQVLLYKRCLEMINNGLMSESKQFYLDQLVNSDLNNIHLPLGIKEGCQVFRDNYDLQMQVRRQQMKKKHLNKHQRKLITNFINQLYISNRQFSKKQKKYFKTQLKDLMIQIKIDENVNVEERIMELWEMNEDEYKQRVDEQVIEKEQKMRMQLEVQVDDELEREQEMTIKRVLKMMY